MEYSFDQSLQNFLRNPCTRTWTAFERTIMEYSNTAYNMRVNAIVNRHENITSLRASLRYISSLPSSPEIQLH
jgi:hypothetical protein